jgi:hypothetical protein
MGFLRRGGDQGTEGAFSEGRLDLPADLLPVSEWAAALRSSLMDEIPEDVAAHQIGLAAEAARIAAESRQVPVAVAAVPGWRERLHLSRVPLHLAAQAVVILAVIMILAGGVAAAVGVDVPALITKPFHFHSSTTIPGTAPSHEGPVGPDLSSTTSLPDDSTTVVDDDTTVSDDDDHTTVGGTEPTDSSDDDSSLDDDEAEEPEESDDYQSADLNAEHVAEQTRHNDHKSSDATDGDADESDHASGSDSSTVDDTEVLDSDGVDDSQDQASDEEHPPED